MLSLSVPHRSQFAVIPFFRCFCFWILVLALGLGGVSQGRKTVVKMKAGGHVLEVIYNRDKGPSNSFYVYKGGSKAFRIWFKYPGSVTAWWIFQQNVLQNDTHLANEGKQVSHLKLSNITHSDAGNYLVFLRPSGVEAVTLAFTFTLVVKLPPRAPSSLSCFHVIRGLQFASLWADIKAAECTLQRERTRFYTISYYQSFTNGSKRFISETAWYPKFSLERTTLDLSRPGMCMNYSVKVTAMGKVSESTPIFSSCHQRNFLRFSYQIFRNLKGQVYLSQDRLTYIPVCLSTPLQQCPDLLKGAFVINTPQMKFISRHFLRFSPSEFDYHYPPYIDQYCSRLAWHCDSNVDAATRLCWKENVTFVYKQNNLTLLEGNNATFSYVLHCPMCIGRANFVWKRGERTLRPQTWTTLKNAAEDFTYRLFGAKKTDSGLYTFRIVVDGTVYSKSFFVTVLKATDSSPALSTDFLITSTVISINTTTWPTTEERFAVLHAMATAAGISLVIFIVVVLFLAIYLRKQRKNRSLTEEEVYVREAAVCSVDLTCREILVDLRPFAIRYSSYSCSTFELFVDSTKLSFKLEESASNKISKSKGGRINLVNYGILIEFPRDSLQEEHVAITASLFISSEPVKGRFLSLLELLPHGIKFDLPVVIRSSYHVAGSRSVDSKLHMFYSEKFRSETFFNYVGELSESSAKASYLKMDYFFGEKFLEIQALSFCNLCSWSEGPCKVAFSVFRNRGSDSKFGVTIALSCAHPDILRALKNYHVQENSKGFLTTSFITWNESWSKMEIALQSDDEWKASATATFTVEDKNTVMKCHRESFLGPTSNFLVTKVASNPNADVTSIQFNINAYETDLTAPVTMTQIIVDIHPLSATNIVTWTGDSDTSSVYSSPSSGNGSSGSRERFSCRSSEGRNIDSLAGLNASGEHRTDSDGYESMPVESAGKNKVTQEQCNKLAQIISPIWKDVARKLSFSTQEIKGIKDEHLGNLDHQSIEMLDRWLIRSGAEATVFILCKALIFSNARGHAESVFGDKVVASVVDVLDCGSAV